MHCSARGAYLLLRVADDGVGLSAQALPSVGLGLKTMRERVEVTGGTLTVETQHPHGTVVEAAIPMISALAPA
jgi:two-component system sensor histidine kinase UhpB